MGLFCILASSRAQAQGTAVPAVETVLSSLGPSPCAEAVGEDVWSVRAAVVVHPDGGWALALGPFGASMPIAETTHHRVHACAQRALSQQLPPRIPRPPRTVAVVSRLWRYESAGMRALRARLDAMRGEIADCVAAAAPRGEGVVHLTVGARGDEQPDVRARGRGPLDRAVARCVTQRLVAVPPVAGTVTFDLAVTPRVPHPTPRPDGSPGAICGWGQRRPDWQSLPEPMACRAGLRSCAAGGAAGSDSVCMRVAMCPLFP